MKTPKDIPILSENPPIAKQQTKLCAQTPLETKRVIAR
jgi:hypothetical protein